MGDSSDDDLPLATRMAPAKPKREEPPSKKVKGEKGGEAGPSLKAGPSKAKIVTEPHSNGASKAAPTQRNKTGKEAQGKAAAKSEKEDVKPKKERKTFEMPGQTRETPDETDPLRKFYISLRDQRPDSVMAKKWLLQTGLLPLDEAQEDVARAKTSKSPAKPARKSGSIGGATTGRSRGTSNGGTSRKPAAKKPAANGAKTGHKIRKAEWSEDEDESSSEEELSDNEPLAKRAKSKPAPARKKAAAPKLPSKKSKDVAFMDGGLGSADSDSEDDIPIGQRLKK